MSEIKGLNSVEKLWWVNAIMAYKEGDITLLEELIRNEGVPIEMANEVADILIGKIESHQPNYHRQQFKEPIS